MNEKEEKLRQLFEELRGDKKLPLQESNLVFGEGDINCSIMFVGEAPGQRENELKRPFVGRSGQLLDKLLGEIGWKRENVYITNIVKRRPPENRDPSEEEIEAYKPYLARQIEIINPKIIAPLGRFSMNYFLPFAKISRDQGKICETGGRLIYPLFHPAAALRATTVLNELRESFKRLPDVILGKIKEETLTLNAKKKEVKRASPDVPQAKLF